MRVINDNFKRLPLAYPLEATGHNHQRFETGFNRLDINAESDTGAGRGKRVVNAVAPEEFQGG